jgi:uncharacterized protein (DUF2062 family)
MSEEPAFSIARRRRLRQRERHASARGSTEGRERGVFVVAVCSALIALVLAWWVRSDDAPPIAGRLATCAHHG